jgi:anti-anti-sigma factor
MTSLSVSVRERREPGPGKNEPGKHDPGKGGSLTIAVTGELDIATVPRFTARMSELARRGRFRELVLDLSGLTFIDVGGLRALTDLRASVEQRGAILVLDGVPPQMRRLIRIIGPTRTFRIR